MKHLNQFFALVATAIISISSLNAAVRTWTGSSSNSWSTNGNWTGNSVPGSTDTVIIPSTVSSNRNPIIGSNVTIRRFVMNGLTVTYSNNRTFTVGADMIINSGTFTSGGTILTNNFTINGGTFNGNGNNFTATNNLIVNNGLFNSGSSNIVANNVDINNGEFRIRSNNLNPGTLVTLDGGVLTNTSTSNPLDFSSDFSFLSGSIDMNFLGMNISGLYYFVDGSLIDPGTLITATNVEIDYTGTHTMGINVRVTGSMTFTSGILESSSTNLLIFDNNATVTGASSVSHVNGPVKKEVSSASTTFIFPIGNGTLYTPLEMSGYTSINNADFFTAQYFGTKHSQANSTMGTGLDHVSQTEYWVLDRGSSGNASTSVNVRISYDATGRSGSVTDIGKLIVARWDGTQWVNHGRGSSSNGNTASGSVITSSIVSNFSPFTFGSISTANPLPVSLLNFNAAAVASNVNVKWTTTSEINNDFFSVEKSLNGTEWISIGKVKGAGNTESLTNYNFVDANPVAGIQYYRLKQTDVNGEFTYSSIAPVNFSANATAQLNIFPMPANNFINVEMPGASEMTVTIYNSNGQKIFESTSVSLLNIDIQDFNAGLYIVEVKADNNVLSSKFLKN